MVVTSPISGMVVLRMVWRVNQQVEIQEGEEARPGMPIMQVVDPSAMLVRVKVNQADVHLLQVGQPARISLDAYPDLQFQGRVEHVAPVGTASMLTTRVRNFVATVSIKGSHPKLLPDLSAAVDVELERKDNVIVVPRDAVRSRRRERHVHGAGARRRQRAVAHRHARRDERSRSDYRVRPGAGSDGAAACGAIRSARSSPSSAASRSSSPLPA